MEQPIPTPKSQETGAPTERSCTVCLILADQLSPSFKVVARIGPSRAALT